MEQTRAYEASRQCFFTRCSVKLNEKLNDCLHLLSQIENGEGVLHKTTMSVNGLGKIDVYHYMYFLVQHARRHLLQMENIQTEIEKLK